MVNIEFEFNLQDNVFITEIERPGIIDSMIYDINGKQYRVAYWNNGDRKTAWLYSREFTLKKEKSKMEKINDTSSNI